MIEMTRLLRVELKRLLRRRAVLLLVLAAVAIPVVIGVSVVLDTQPVSDAELAEAERQVEAERNRPGLQKEIRRCAEDPDYLGMPSDLSEEELLARCTEEMEPQLEWYLWQPQLDLAQERDSGSGIAVTLVLAITMLLVGTTFTGHDWASGSVSNQLLFEPRRARIWFAKAIVVTGAALAVAAAVLTSYWLGLGAVARSRDLDVGDGLLLDCLQMGWRGAGVAAVAALTGFALTMLFRSTVATLGILLAVALAGGLVLGILGFEGRWNPAYNLAAVITDGTTYYAELACTPDDPEFMDGGGYCVEERTITLAQGVGYLGAVVLAVCALSLLSFRRRDVP